MNAEWRMENAGARTMSGALGLTGGIGYHGNVYHISTLAICQDHLFGLHLIPLEGVCTGVRVV
jgi:hypothetical protein